VDEVAAGLLLAGGVVRLDDPQAHRVERVVLVDGRVVVELRPVGLDVANAVRVTLPVDRLVERRRRGGDNQRVPAVVSAGGQFGRAGLAVGSGRAPCRGRGLLGRERRATTALAPPSFAVSALPAGTPSLAPAIVCNPASS
jgi:hypothetical protein